jgi:GT2 family glycosyltransferase
VPLANWIDGFSAALNGSIAYAGHVSARGQDRLSMYYESQKILVPPPGREGYPAYVITANALVWREAFDVVGGFNDAFRYAAGEDIDLGLRLWRIGDISYAPRAIVQHDFEPSISSFLRRFIRYGRGNCCLARRYGASLWPRPFLPATLSAFNLAAAFGQLAAMAVGYSLEASEHR